jgi:hypothetical protein
MVTGRVVRPPSAANRGKILTKCLRLVDVDDTGAFRGRRVR